MKQTGKTRGHMHPRKQSLRLPSTLVKQRQSTPVTETKNTKTR